MSRRIIGKMLSLEPANIESESEEYWSQKSSPMHFLQNNILHTFPAETIASAMHQPVPFSDHEKADEGPMFC
jgi:hypothetical protein